MKGPFLQSAELGRKENESQRLFHKSDVLACHLLCYSRHMAFPCTYTCCSICVWLFAQQGHSPFLFFVCRDDHQMKGIVASNAVSVRINRRWLVFSSWCWSREKEDNPRKQSCFDFYSHPSAGSGTGQHHWRRMRSGFHCHEGYCPEQWLFSTLTWD